MACAGRAADVVVAATAGAPSGVLRGVTANKGASGAGVRLFSSASSNSMRAFMAANSLAISAVLAGSGAAAGRVEDTSGDAPVDGADDAPVTAAGSWRAATFAGASGCAAVCA